MTEPQRLLVVCCLLFLGNCCDRGVGQVSGSISKQDLLHYTSIAQTADMTDSLNLYMATSIFSFVGVECPLQCDDIVSKIGTSPTVARIYHIGAALKACSCSSKPALDTETILSAARSQSLSDIHHAMRVLRVFDLETHDFNWVDVVENVVELMAEDGTFAASVTDGKSSVRNTGLALDAIAIAISFMDSDTKESAWDLVEGSGNAAKTLMRAAEDNCRGLDTLFLGSAHRLEATSSVLGGTINLLRQFRDRIDITPSNIYRFGNYFVSQKSAGNLADAFHVLVGLTTVMDNPVATPVTVITTPMISDSSTEKYVVSIQNLLGKPAGKCQVSLSVTNTADNSIFLESEPMLATAGSGIDYELDLLQDGPLPGLYSMEINVENKAKSIRVQVKRALKVTTQINRCDIVFSRASRPAGAPVSTQTTSFPEPFVERVAVPRSTPFMRLSLSLSSSSGPLNPHQVMVRFTSVKGGKSTYFVLETDSKVAGQHGVMIDCRDKKAWVSESGDHRVVIIVGDDMLEKSVVWDLGMWSLRLPSRSKTVPLYRESLLHESETTMHALPEIIHQFREPAPRPPEAISLLFTGIVVLPLAIYVLHTILTHSTRATELAGVWAFLFQLCIGAMFSLFFLYWYSLDLFTTLHYLVPLSVVTVGIGSFTLQKLTR